MNILKCVILSAVLLALSACSDYVAEIDEQIKDLNVKLAHEEDSPVNPNIEYGQLTDSRDGQTYKTVVIGSQTWMAQNLNYETSHSYCYNDDASNCAKYGRLYTWTAATTACPSGWHLPSKVEWDTLITAVGGSKTAGKVLKATSGWDSDGNGTDSFGFSALPAGGRGGGGYYYSEGDCADFWSSTEVDRDYVHGMRMYYNGGYVDTYKCRSHLRQEKLPNLAVVRYRFPLQVRLLWHCRVKLIWLILVCMVS